MFPEQFPPSKHNTTESKPIRRKLAAEILAVTALFSLASPNTANSVESNSEPTPAATSTSLETDPTPGAVEQTEPTPTPSPETSTSEDPSPIDSTETTPPTAEAPRTTIVTTNTPLRIRTTNVTGRHMDGFKSRSYDKRPYYATWNERRAGLIKDITGIKVDAMGLQEVDAGVQSDYIRSELGKRGYKTLDAWKKNINPIYWDVNKLTPISGSTFALGDRDGHRGSWLRLKDKKTAQELVFINAHFESELSSKGNTDRVRAAKSVAKISNVLSKGGDIPVFMMGDFNSDLWDDPYDALRASKNSNGIYPVEAHTQTTNRLNYKFNTANMYYPYRKNGTTKGQTSHVVIDQAWYYKTVKNDDGTTINIRTDRTYNDLPTIYHNKKHGAYRTTDHNPQIIYLNLETKKTVEITE